MILLTLDKIDFVYLKSDSTPTYTQAISTIDVYILMDVILNTNFLSLSDRVRDQYLNKRKQTENHQVKPNKVSELWTD